MLKILTLNWNGRDKLEKLYPTLVNSLTSIRWEWYIKDNGSKDSSAQLEQIWNNSNIHIIQYPHNKDTFSYGCNFLFREARPEPEDHILLLNNDIAFNDTHSIQNMLSIIENDDQVGAVGARLLYTGTDMLQHAGVVFDPTYRTPMHFRTGQKSDASARRNRLFQAVTGAVLITKAKYFEQSCTTNKSGLSGFDEGFRWSFDDIDLCLSIKYNMNKKIVYCGNTNIFHEESASLKKNPTNKLFLSHNLKYMFAKWKGRYVIDKEIYTKNPKYNLYNGGK